MFSFFKRDNVQKELDDNTNSFQEVISVICIMLEISRLDGKIDENDDVFVFLKSFHRKISISKQEILISSGIKNIDSVMLCA